MVQAAGLGCRAEDVGADVYTEDSGLRLSASSKALDDSTRGFLRIVRIISTNCQR